MSSISDKKVSSKFTYKKKTEEKQRPKVSSKTRTSKVSDKTAISKETKEKAPRKGFSSLIDRFKDEVASAAPKAESSASKPESKNSNAPKAASGEAKKESGGIIGKAVSQAKEFLKDPEVQERRSERENTENNHLRNLESNYSLFDNPGGGDTDGTISLKDIEKVADGDYDADAAREKLREAGVPEREIEEQIGSARETANFLLENDRFRERLDKANDGDGDVDDKISRGDLDKVLIEAEKQEREDRLAELDAKASEPPSEAHIKEAQEAVNNWSEPGRLEQDLKEKPLSELSEAELDALVAVNEQSPENQELIEEAVLRSVHDAEELGELPQGDSFNYLLQKHLTGKEIDEENPNTATARARDQLGGLVRDEVELQLDDRLQDRSGDKELDLALERFSGNLEGLAIENPALTDIIAEQAEATAIDFSDEFTEVARRDDNFLQKTNHAITGGIRSGVGFVTDGFREGVGLLARVNSVPGRIGGRIGNFVLDNGGRLAGAGLDAVGADGAADAVRNASDKAGDFVQDTADFIADQSENFTNGLGESVAGAVDGLAYLATDPVGTVQGIGRVIQDPSLLLEGYKETAEEHGAAGVAGQVVGDVALTVLTGGGGAAAKGSGIAGRIASFASRGGRAGRVLGRGATSAQRFLNVLDDPAAAASRFSARQAAGGSRFGDDLARAGQGAERFFDGVGQGRAQVRQGARRFVRDGVEVVENLPGVDRLKSLAEPVTSSVGRAADRLRGPDARAFSRRAKEFRRANPQLIDDIARVRRDFKSLDNPTPEEFKSFLQTKGPSGFSPLELAERIDELSAGRFPDGVGALEASGRAHALRTLIDEVGTSRLPDADQARRLARGVLADSDPSGPVFITRLSSDDRLFRAFDSRGNADGGYFARARDRHLSRAQNRSNNVLPDKNRADRGVVITPEDGSFALVSRVGAQAPDGDKFLTGAAGGGWQFQLFTPKRIRDTLEAIADDLPFPKMPFVPVVIANPSILGRPGLVAPGLGRPAVILGEEVLDDMMHKSVEGKMDAMEE